MAANSKTHTSRSAIPTFYILCECPDHVSAAAVSLAVSASGLVHTKTIPLLTVEEADRALSMKTSYRAPGAGKVAKVAKA